MTSFGKLLLPLTVLAAMTLSACQGSMELPDPINPNSGATFRVHAVMYDSLGEPATRPRGGAVLGEDAQRYTDRNGEILIVTLPAIVDENCLKSISASEDEFVSRPVLNFEFDEDCAKIFGEYTAKNVNKRMAVVLNGELMTAPTIRAAITSGAGFIEGGFETLEEAEAIAKTFY